MCINSDLCFQTCWVDSPCDNCGPLDQMCSKSPLPRSISSALVSWSDAIWPLFLSPRTLLRCPSKFLTFFPLPPPSFVHTLLRYSVPCSPLFCLLLSERTDVQGLTLPSLPSCHHFFTCAWVRALPVDTTRLLSPPFAFFLLLRLPPLLVSHLSQPCLLWCVAINTAAGEPKTEKHLLSVIICYVILETHICVSCSPCLERMATVSESVFKN